MGSLIVLQHIVGSLILLASLGMSGCQNEAPLPSVTFELVPDIRGAVEKIDATRDNLLVVSGSGEAGDNDFSFSAYYDGQTLRYIQELSDLGDYGFACQHYYFENGSLIYFEESKQLRRSGDAVLRDVSNPMETIRTRIAYRRDATFIGGEKTVDGVRQSLYDWEPEGALTHAKTLVATAQTEYRRTAN